LLAALTILAACSPQTVIPTALPGEPTARDEEIPPPIADAQPEEILPTSSPAAFQNGIAAGDLLTPTLEPTKELYIRDIKVYHTILMLQRSADLTMTLIKRMQAGEIQSGDLDSISLYNIAFVLAGTSFNDAKPPEDYGQVWSRAYAIIQQYNTIYTWLSEGKTISKENLVLLQESRQFLTLDQQLIEKFLIPKGLGEDFFAEEREAVDQHLETAYGDLQVPEILP
jgi:hypothetical protein